MNNKTKKNTNTNKEDSIEQMRRIFNKLDNSKKVTNISKDKPQTVDEIIKKWTVNEKIVKLFENSINNELELKQKYAITLIIILAIQLIILNIIFT